jgi:hypothetical protein
MTNAWFLGATAGVPQSESEVRDTLEPIRDDGDLAEQDAPPDWNEPASDKSGELTGLAPRVEGSFTTDTVKTAPFWAPLANVNHNALVDNQVASSGTAASRELAGQHGHGTMQYEVGIDPLIRDGAAFGNDYFVSHDPGIQDGAGAYMSPPGQDNWASSVAQSMAERRSREAYMSTAYANFYAGK